MGKQVLVRDISNALTARFVELLESYGIEVLPEQKKQVQFDIEAAIFAQCLKWALEKKESSK